MFLANLFFNHKLRHKVDFGCLLILFVILVNIDVTLSAFDEDCSGDNGVCSTPAEACNGAVCVCRPGYTQQASACVVDFKVEFVELERKTTSIKVSWYSRRESEITGYRIQVTSPISRTVAATSTGGQINDLTPGVEYSLSLVSYIDDGSDLEKTASVDIVAWTKPETPTRPLNITADRNGYTFSFTGSIGHKVGYRVLVDSFVEEPPIIKESFSDNPVIFFSNIELKATQVYKFYIYSLSGNYHERNDKPLFLVTQIPDPEKLENVRLKDTTSESARVVWRKPLVVDDEIRGYQLTISEGSTCKLLYKHSYDGDWPQINTPNCETARTKTHKKSDLEDNNYEISQTVEGLSLFTSYTASLDLVTASGISVSKVVPFKTSNWNQQCRNHMSCDISLGLICDVVASSSIEKRCVCLKYEFWKDTSCESMRDTKLTHLTGLHIDDTIIFSWYSPERDYVTGYELEIRKPIQHSQHATYDGTELDIVGLIPGTKYEFGFKSHVSDSNGKNETFTVTADQWADPAKPRGPVRVLENGDNYEIVFQDSIGERLHYTAQFIHFAGSEVIKRTSNEAKFVISKAELIPGSSYFYSIVSVNGGDASSEEDLRGVLKIPDIATEMVENVQVKVSGSENITVTWTRPRKLSGDLNGYLVYLKRGSSCLYFNELRCVECGDWLLLSTQDCPRSITSSLSKDNLREQQIEIELSADGLTTFIDYKLTITTVVDSHTVGSVTTSFRMNKFMESCDQSLECDESLDLQCIPDTNGAKVCRCSEDYFWKDNKCAEMSELHVTSVWGVAGSRDATNHWHAPNSQYVSRYTFDILHPISRRHLSSLYGVYTIDLVPGTLYDFAITSVVIERDNYEKESSTFYSLMTDPAPPNDPVVITKTSTNYIITFNPSVGLRKYYRITLTSNDYPSVQKSTIREETEFVFATSELVKGAVYFFEMVSVNQRDVDSISKFGVLKIPDKEKTEDSSCISSSECDGTRGLECVIGTCQCGSANYWTGQLCQQKKTEGSSCISSSECDGTRGLECVSGTCQCGSANYWTGQLCQQSNNDKDSYVVEIESLDLSSERRSNGRIDLYIQWTLVNSTERISYTVLIEEQVTPLEKMQRFMALQTLAGYEHTTLFISNVLAYWTYRVTVTPETPSEPGRNVTETITTKMTNPGMASNLHAEQDEVFAKRYKLTFNCPDIKERNGPLKEFNVRVQVKATKEILKSYTRNVESLGSCDVEFVLDDNLIGALPITNTYTIGVQFTNDKYEGSFQEVELELRKRAPNLNERFPTKVIVEAGDSVKTTDSSVSVRICADCVKNKENGEITQLMFLVCVEPCYDIPGSIRQKREVMKIDQLLNWATAKSIKFKNVYRATSDGFISELGNGDNWPYTLGSDTTCSETADSVVYCNGPLPSNRQIRVSLVVCNEAGCDVAALENTLKTEPSASQEEEENNESEEDKEEKDELKDEAGDENNTILIVAVTCSVAVVLIISIIIFIIYKRKTKPVNSGSNTMEFPNCTVATASSTENATVSPTENDLRSYSRPLKIVEFGSYVINCHRQDNRPLQSEFQGVQRMSKLLSRSRQNSGFRLGAGEQTITATVLPGYKNDNEYIATEVPTNETAAEFWSLVWNKDVCAIVMLSNDNNDGQESISSYVSGTLNSPKTYGDITVITLSVCPRDKHLVRSIILLRDGMEKTLTHVLLPGWMDLNASVTIHDVLHLVDDVQQMKQGFSRPIALHCSWGMGLVGTFMALHKFYQEIQNKDLQEKVDVLEYVMRLNQLRPGMIGSETQYVYIHDSIKVMIEKIQNNLYASLIAPNAIGYSTWISRDEENVYEQVEPSWYEELLDV